VSHFNKHVIAIYRCDYFKDWIVWIMHIREFMIQECNENFVFITFLDHKFILQARTYLRYSLYILFPSAFSPVIIILLYSFFRPKTRVTLKTAIKQSRNAYVATVSSPCNPSSSCSGIILDHPLYSPFTISEQIRDISLHDEMLETCR